MCEYANYVQGNSNDTVKAWTTFTCSPSGLILRQEGKIQESLEQFQVITVVVVRVLLMSLVPGLGLQHPEPQQCG